MAGFSDKITVIIDVATEKAKSGLASFKQSVGEAEGFTGKLKAGVGSLVGELGPGALAGAATAAAGAAVKLASEFSDLGVQVGKFSDATGLSTEESSRWIEVAGDLGIEAEGLQTVIGKLNKSVDPALFKEYGIEIAKAADGTTDANKTFLNAIDALHAMKDPTERAKAGAKLFGKGWQQVAEIVSMSASEIRGRLDDVAGAKVFDREKVAEARRFRDAMDTLHDSFQNITLTLGESLVPALSDTAKAIGETTDLLGPMINLLGKAQQASNMFNPFHWISVGYDKVKTAYNAIADGNKREQDAKAKLTAANDAYGESLGRSAEKQMHMGKQTEDTVEAFDAEKAAIDRARRSLQGLNEIQLDSVNAQVAAFQAQQDWIESEAKLKDTLKDSEATLVDKTNAVINAAVATADMAAAQDKANGAEQTADERKQILLDSLAKVAGTLDPKSPLRKNLDAYIASLYSIPTTVGPKLNDPFTGQSAAAGRGRGPDGAPMVVNVYTKADPNEVIAIIRKYERQNGRAVI